MANPTVVQAIAFSSITNSAITVSLANNGEIFINLDPVAVGNSIAILFDYDGSFSPITAGFSCTDDQGNSYTGVTGGHNTTNDQSAGAFYKIGISAPVKQIRLKNISGGGKAAIGGAVIVFNDVIAVDVTNGATSSGTAVTGGSLAVTQTGDLLVLYGARTSSVQTTSFTPTSQSNVTWQLVTSDIIDGQALQAGVYNSSSSINPQMDMGTTGQWASVAIAFKAGSSGSPRAAGMRICAIHHTSVYDLSDNPLKLQVPAVGNLIVIMRSGGAQPSFNGLATSITDTNGNTWVVGSALENDASQQILYAANAVGGNGLILTINLATASGHHSYMIYDIAGADAAPIGNQVTTTGTQTDTGDLTTCTIDPTVTGLILGMVSWAQSTAKSVNDTGMVFDAIRFDGETEDGPCPSDENNGWAHAYNAGRSSFVWRRTTARAAAGWESSAIALKAANQPPIVTDNLVLMPQGSM